MKESISSLGQSVGMQEIRLTTASGAFRAVILHVSCKHTVNILAADNACPVSFAGLTYLALFFCAKFAITLPFLNYKNPSNRDESDLTSPRSQAAAPPTYLVIFPLISIALAIYVASTRYSDFYHHGFDIIVGAILGIASAWLGFRWYHLPIGRGGGWAWAPRSPDRAFIRGIGVVTYANDWPFQGNGRDLESGPVSNASRGTKNSDGSAGIELDDMGQVKHLEPGVPNNSTQQPPR